MFEPLLVKHFNTAGPQIATLHYSIDPLARIKLAEIESLVAQQRYFVLHAPRQTGKTTCLLALHFNAGNKVRAVYANIESAQAARNDIASAAQAILSVLAQQVQSTLGIDALELNRQKLLDRGANAAFGSALRLLAQGAHGSMRDALSITDQAIAFGHGKVEEQQVRQMLGNVDRDFVWRVLDAVVARDAVVPPPSPLLDAVPSVRRCRRRRRRTRAD